MAPSGTLVLRPVELRDKKMPIEESTMPDRHDKNIEKVFPVFGHRFVAKVRVVMCSKMNTVCRRSTSLSIVQWTEISSGVSGNRQFAASYVVYHDDSIMHRACLVSNVE